MVFYETLMLLRTEVTKDELGMIERHFEEQAEKANGKMVTFDKWGKYKLAYPIRSDEYGVYLLARYQVPQKAFAILSKELGFFFKIKCSDIVMRHVTVKLDSQAPTSYVKPEPIDGSRSGSFDSFLKEHKMEGILSTKVGKQALQKSEKEKMESIDRERKETSILGEESRQDVSDEEQETEKD